MKKTNTELEIIYEDDDILAINKPKGMVMYPGAGYEEESLLSNLLDRHVLSDLDKNRPRHCT